MHVCVCVCGCARVCVRQSLWSQFTVSSSLQPITTQYLSTSPSGTIQTLFLKQAGLIQFDPHYENNESNALIKDLKN